MYPRENFQNRRTALERKNEKAYSPLTKERTLTSAQILALFTTPIQIVAAVPGQTIIPTRVMLQKPAGTAYAGANAFQLRLKDGTGQVLVAVTSALLLNSVNAISVFAPGMFDGSVFLSQLQINHADAVGQPLVAFIPVANPTLGTSVVNIVLEYIVVPGVPIVYPRP